MMEGFTVGLFSVSYQGDLSEVSKVKLSGRVQTRMVGSQGIVWAGNTSLAILTGDLTVRLWDIETNDNYVLSTVMKIYDTDDKFNTVNEIFTCITYCKVNQTLCAGTNIGRIYFWTRKQNQVEIENPEDSWELTNVNAINGTIKQLKWGSFISRLPLLSVNCVTSVYIMKEQRICSKFSEKIWGTQKTASQILLESAKSDYLLQLDSQVTDMAISENLLAFTNGRKIFMYAVTWEKDNNILELNSGKAKGKKGNTVNLAQD
nr:intraflagellar transport protein 140 homolog [Leptinotarsa decemlineata]